MAYEVGAAYVTVLPRSDGFANALGQQLDGPFSAAGQRGGGLLADGVNRGGAAPMAASGKAMGALFVAGFAAIGAGQIVDAVVGWMTDAVSAASDLAETQSKVNQIFGDGTDALLEYAETADERLGQSQQTFLDGASTLGIFGQSAGLAGDDLVGFSTGLVGLATDLASFNNTSPEDAIEAIGAALRGESEPIRRYGILLDDATLKARALALGIYEGSGSLTQQQRILAAHAEILAQTGTQQGDFARTSDGLANSQRIFNAELANFEAEVGTALLPTITALFGVFTDVGMPVLELFSDFLTENPEVLRIFVTAVLQGILGVVEGFLIWQQVVNNFGIFFTGVMESIANATLSFVGFFVDASAAAFGWVPGVGDNLTQAQQDFADFRDGVSEKFDQIRQVQDLFAASIDVGRSAVDLLQESISNLDGTTATAQISVLASGNGWEFISQGAGLTPYFNTSGGSRRLSTGPAFRAEGGPVDAGRPYVVGERSWELFVPDRPGTIYNPQQLAAMAGGGSRGGNVFNISGQRDPVATAHETARVWRMAEV